MAQKGDVTNQKDDVAQEGKAQRRQEEQSLAVTRMHDLLSKEGEERLSENSEEHIRPNGSSAHLTKTKQEQVVTYEPKAPKARTAKSPQNRRDSTGYQADHDDCLEADT